MMNSGVVDHNAEKDRIRLQGVSFEIGSKSSATKVFQHLTAEIPSKRRFLLIGEASSGKTSLIRLIAGLSAPSAGKIHRSGAVSFPVGFSGGFRPKLSIWQNLKFIAELYSFETEELVDFVAREAEIADLLGEKFGNIGAKERSKLCYATSYALHFDTYLIDGPVGAGDEKFRERCAELLEARSEHAGYIMAVPAHVVPHLRRAGRRHGDCGAILRNGQLEHHDNVEDLMRAFQSSPR